MEQPSPALEASWSPVTSTCKHHAGSSAEQRGEGTAEAVGHGSLTWENELHEDWIFLVWDRAHKAD